MKKVVIAIASVFSVAAVAFLFFVEHKNRKADETQK